MRTLTKILLASALALAVSNSASAAVSTGFTQFGGTYDALVGASAGDTLILDVTYSITGGSSPTLIDPLIDLAGTATFVSALETGPTLWGTSFGQTALGPITNGDVGMVNIGDPGEGLNGVDRSTGTDLSGAGVPCAGGGLGCTVMARLTLSLTGLGGVIDMGSLLQPIGNGTFAAGAGGTDITGSVSWGTFTIVPVPEPTTASLLGLGLLGLSVAGRNRKN